KNTSSGARDAEIRHGNEQMKKLKARYGVTTLQELRRNRIKEEMRCPRQHGYAVTRVNGYGITNSKSINRALIFAFEISIPGVVSQQQEEGGKGTNSPGMG
ncbi:hypothetical protein Tco_1534566, partial [Tanacetum coccineum]